MFITYVYYITFYKNIKHLFEKFYIFLFVFRIQKKYNYNKLRFLYMIYWILGVFAAIFIILPFIMLDRFSAKQFSKKMDASYRLEAKDFGLEFEKVGFKNRDGKNLKGCIYFKKGRDSKDLILLIPGFKNNHNNYLPEIEYFTSRGYLVFSFDPASTGKSEGAGVKGLLQIPYDAQSALEHIKQDARLNSYPLLLWGFSNGGYAALGLINDQKVTAAAALSAFCDINGMTVDHAVLSFGKLARMLYPYCVIYNRLKYGKNPFGKSPDNLRKCGKPVFLAHGTADKAVPYINFLKLRKCNDHSLSVNLSIEGGEHWIRYESRVNSLRHKIRKRLEIAPSEKKAELKKYYAFVARKINFELVKKIADFYDAALQNQ
jgi:pimeloyl-ACP methyl ester carboxylesterase